MIPTSFVTIIHLQTSVFFLLASTAQDAATRIIQNNVIFSNI